ncbi:hypothetical protein D3C81_1765090 [compost metagenome]
MRRDTDDSDPYGGGRAGAIGVVGQGPAGSVVQDAVIGIQRCGAKPEEGTRCEAGVADRAVDSATQSDLVHP